MASKFVVVQPLSVQIAIFLPAGRWPRHQWFRRDNQFYWHAAQRNSIFSGGSYGASAQTARLLSTCKIPILQLIVMAVWRGFVGSQRR